MYLCLCLLRGGLQNKRKKLTGSANLQAAAGWPVLVLVLLVLSPVPSLADWPGLAGWLADWKGRKYQSVS